MKILYFSRDYTPHDHRILSSLSQTDHQVYYLRLEHGEYTYEDRPLPREIQLLEWNRKRRTAGVSDAPALLRELKSIARKIRPDLVQAGPLQRSALLAALAGLRPLVSMSWGYDLLLDAGRNAAWRQATRFTLKRSDLLIGDCETIRRLAVSYGMSAERIVTFPWGIDLEHFSPPVKPGKTTAPGLPRTFTLLSTRSWEPLYGVDTIVQAFLQARQDNLYLRLVMLGNGSQAPDLKQRLSEADLLSPTNGTDPTSDRPVELPGQVGFTSLPQQYHRSDLYLSASHSDGTSISMLEAMACGLPVLVSDIPGNREWVQPGENGWLFPVGDPAALASAIQQAYRERERLAEMGASARRTAETRADWQVNFQKMLQAYERVVHAG